MQTIEIEAQMRTNTGKEDAKKVHASQNIPAQVYGKGQENLNIMVKKLDMHKYLLSGHGKNTVFCLNLGTTKINVIPYEIQVHPISKQIRHIDFKAINNVDPVRISLAIRTSGIALGTKKGGRLEHKLDHITISVMPDDIVNQIEVDVTNLDLGQEILVKDLPLPASAKVLKVRPDFKVFRIKG